MIFFDHQTFLYQNYGGISKLFSEVLQYLHNNNVSFQISLEQTLNHNILNRSYYKGNKITSVSFENDPNKWLTNFPFPGKGYLHKLYTTRAIQKENLNKSLIWDTAITNSLELLSQKEVSVFHPTYFDDYYMEFLSQKDLPLVITIFDLIHERFPGYFGFSDFVIKNRRKLLERANKIISISNSTKNDLVYFYNIPEDKIKVIHLASETKEIERLDNFLFQDFILFVGDRWSYKNFQGFIRASAPFLKKSKSIVICAGSVPFSAEETKLFETLGISGLIVHYPILNSNELGELYSKAKFFVFPSLYEGFGIPLLEAMSYGCPIACSNTSSFPEVVGNAAVQFDPWDSESIEEAMYEIFNSESKREDLKKKGNLRVKNFSWEKCGSEHLEVYKSLSKKPLVLGSI